MTPRTPTSPTGQQWVVAHGAQQAVVTEMGGTVRSYTVGGLDVIDGFGPQEWSHSGRGQVLAPWPNRLGDGRYQFGEVTAQAALDEPELRNAIHGLVRWLSWRLEGQAQNVLTLRCPLRPTPGYPFSLDLRVEYRLGRDGLTVTTTASNVGDGPLPFGLGFHPYLTVGGERVDSAVLRLPATHRLALDDRSLPTGQVLPVGGTEYDFTGGRAIGTTRMDTAFTGLQRAGDGRAWASLDGPVGGRGVDLWVDDRFGYLMCYTGDTLGDVARRRTAVAVEPMTCPPDAFRTGRDLVVLDPGDEWEGAWGLRPR